MLTISGISLVSLFLIKAFHWHAFVCLVQGLIWKIGDTGLTDPGLSLKVIVVMRPCDGMSGLVRGTAERRFSRLRGQNG